jgi:hypothetical protein
MNGQKSRLLDEILELTPKLNEVLEEMQGEGASLAVFLMQSIAKACDEKTLDAIAHDLRQFIIKQKGEDYLLQK